MKHKFFFKKVRNKYFDEVDFAELKYPAQKSEIEDTVWRAKRLEQNPQKIHNSKYGIPVEIETNGNSLSMNQAVKAQKSETEGIKARKEIKELAMSRIT
mgnify:CR=1 FL=1